MTDQETITHQPIAYSLSEQADWQISFIERLSMLSVNFEQIYDKMQEDTIKAIGQCFINLDIIQKKIQDEKGG
jgi:CHAT domain-containing protein